MPTPKIKVQKGQRTKKKPKKKSKSIIKNKRLSTTDASECGGVSMTNAADSVHLVQIQSKSRRENPMKGRKNITTITSGGTGRDMLRNHNIIMMSTFQNESSRNAVGALSSNASMRSPGTAAGKSSNLPRIKDLLSSKGPQTPSAQPSDSVNQRYDKHLSLVVDKYKAQELHLKKL